MSSPDFKIKGAPWNRPESEIDRVGTRETNRRAGIDKPAPFLSWERSVVRADRIAAERGQ